MTTILKTQEELEADSERRLNGEEPLAPEDSENYVGDVPDEFKAWLEDNKERAKGWVTMPYFVRDNPQYVDNFRVDTYSAAERTFTRHYHTSPAMKASMDSYLHKLYPDIPNTELAAIYDYTRGDVSDFRHLNAHLRKGNLSEFEQAFSELLSQGLSKLPTTEEAVYRTIRLNKTRLSEWVDTAQRQGEMTFTAFTSTSLSNDSITERMDAIANSRNKNETDILIVIKGKSGHPIEEISMFNGRNGLPNQREVLFDKGCRFKFEDLTQQDGLFVFHLTEI